MKELISLDGNGNKFRIIRGGDGDIHLGFDCPEKGVFLESVRVGVGNSGGQEVPAFVKRALIHLHDAMERWEQVESKKCIDCRWYREPKGCCAAPANPFNRLYPESDACELFVEKPVEQIWEPNDK